MTAPVRPTARALRGAVPVLATLFGFTGACTTEGSNDDEAADTSSGSEDATSTESSDETESSSTDSGTTDSGTTDSGTESTTMESGTESTTMDSGTESTTDSETDSGTDSETDSTTMDSETESGTDTGVPNCDCAENTDLIYVLSDTGELWSYDPVSNQFALISADLGCPPNQLFVFSMAVDRKGIAHVMFQNGDIYTIDVNNPNMCLDPMYQPDQLGFNRFSMGFVSNDDFEPCETLYAHTYVSVLEGPDAGRLGRLDPETLTMEVIDFIDYAGGELTGTGDGRLFAFAGIPAKLIEYDTSNAQVIAVEQLGMNLTAAFALGFYGGDFYLFTEDNNPAFSKVRHYDHDDTKALTVVAHAPIRVVAAGVSTCAPLTM
jgi:hypothetical protein